MIIIGSGMSSGSQKKLAQPKLLAKHNAIIKPIAAYGGLFTLLVGGVSIGYYQPGDGSAPAASALAAQTAPAETTTSVVDTATIDERVSTSIAATFAMQTDMPTAANVANLNTSLVIKEELAQVDESVISKPQIVQPTSEVRDIVTYTAQAGDSAQSVAEQFGVSVDTIKWANDLASDAIEEGRELTILPLDGIIYTVTGDDTLESISTKYGASQDRIVSYNDLELSGLASSTKIIIPGGVLPEDERPGYTPPAPAPAPIVTQTYGGSSLGVGSSRARISAGNAYAFGNCTSYAYERRAELGRPIGSFWGNATSWAASGSSAGFAVNGTPAPGAIMQNGGGYGHVAIVEAVHPDGSITISDMNGIAGFNRIGHKTVSAAEALGGKYRYIH